MARPLDLHQASGSNDGSDIVRAGSLATSSSVVVSSTTDAHRRRRQRQGGEVICTLPLLPAAPRAIQVDFALRGVHVEVRVSGDDLELAPRGS